MSLCLRGVGCMLCLSMERLSEAARGSCLGVRFKLVVVSQSWYVAMCRGSRLVVFFSLSLLSL
jgi:hypothetical protein